MSSLHLKCGQSELRCGVSMKYKSRSLEKNLKDLFICGAAVIKYHKLGSLWTTEIYFSQFRKLGNLLESVSGESPPGGSKRSHPLVCPHLAKEARELFGVLFRRTLTPCMMALSSWPYHLPKIPPPIVIIEDLTYELRDTNIQSEVRSYHISILTTYWNDVVNN